MNGGKSLSTSCSAFFFHNLVMGERESRIKRTALEPNQICVSGGGARSEVLLQLIATLLDHELLVSPRQYDSATGAALIALSATSGKALEKVVEDIKKKYDRVEPRAEYSSYMKERKNTFKELYTANIGLFN
jgi:xylulokinase